MILGRLTYERPGEFADKDRKYKSDGFMYYDPAAHRAAICKYGMRTGFFSVRPYENIDDPPFLSGDLIARLPARESPGGGITHERLWCGFVASDQDASGNVVYSVIIENLPLTIRDGKVWLSLEEE